MHAKPLGRIESERRHLPSDVDREQIKRYNSVQVEGAKLVLESVPEPFIGNPRLAKVVLLLLNPGHKPEDRDAHCDPVFKAALFRNLQQEAQDYPFYPLNPALSWTPSAKWWTQRLRDLKASSGLSCRRAFRKAPRNRVVPISLKVLWAAKDTGM